MDYFSPAEILERIEELITAFEQNEPMFYVCVDIAHQLKDEVTQAIADYDGNE